MAIKALWKTTLIIWSSYDPREVNPEDLGHDVVESDALCTKQESTFVTDIDKDDDWDGDQSFFWDSEKEE